MNTQMERPKGHTATYDENPHVHDQDVGVQLGHNDDEHHSEKKSVLKKVKAKAKKIKDTIKEHVGHGNELHHGHNHDEDEDEDAEIVADPESHGTHAAQSFKTGHEGVARQHEPKLEDTTTDGGATIICKPGDDYQTFDPKTARYVPGQDETLGWSRTDTGRPKELEERPYAPTNTPVVVMHSGEGHSASTGALEMGKKGPHAKLGGTVEALTGMEKDPQAAKYVGEGCHPDNYQAKVADPTGIGHDSIAAQRCMPGLHRSKLGERTTVEGVIQADPSSKPQSGYKSLDPTTTSYVPGQEETLGCSRAGTEMLKGSGLDKRDLGERTPMEGVIQADPLRKPQSGYKSFDPTTTSYVPGQEETLGCSRAGTEMLKGSGLDKSDLGERTPMKGVVHADPLSKPHSGYKTFNPTTTSYVPRQEDTLGWSRTDAGTLKESDESFVPGLHRRKLDERSPMEGVIHADPSSKPQRDYKTFDPTTTSYVPGQEETLGWSKTDTGMLKGSEESFMPAVHKTKLGETNPAEGVIHANPSSKPQSVYNTFNPTPTSFVSGQKDTLGWSRTDIGTQKSPEEQSDRDVGKLGGILGSSELLEKDPHAPKDPGEKRHADNYESKVTDPTGMGGEEIGVTPILHQLDRFHIQDESPQQPTTGQQESMFKPKHSPQDEKVYTGSHDQFSPEPVTSETNVFSEAPESVSQFGTTSPGSSGSHDNSEQKQGSYTEKISSAAAVMADKAKQATSSVTSKLGYGGTHRGPQPVQEGTASKGGSIVGTVKEKIAPVYNKVTEVGSTMASKVQGSGKESEVVGQTTTEPSTGADRGVSVKTYLVEKLKPGEEDKALAEVITEALPLHKRKEDVSGVEAEGEGRKVTIKGRVTESEEVARELGRSEETNYDNAGTGLASPGKGVMERIKDAAGAWFQRSGDASPKDTTEGNGHSPSIASKESEQTGVGEPKLQ